MDPEFKFLRPYNFGQTKDHALGEITIALYDHSVNTSLVINIPSLGLKISNREPTRDLMWDPQETLGEMWPVARFKKAYRETIHKVTPDCLKPILDRMAGVRNTLYTKVVEWNQLGLKDMTQVRYDLLDLSIIQSTPNRSEDLSSFHPGKKIRDTLKAITFSKGSNRAPELVRWLEGQQSLCTQKRRS